MLLFGVEIGSDEECLVSDAAATRKAVYSTEYYTCSATIQPARKYGKERMRGNLETKQARIKKMLHNDSYNS